MVDFAVVVKFAISPLGDIAESSTSNFASVQASPVSTKLSREEIRAKRMAVLGSTDDKKIDGDECSRHKNTEGTPKVGSRPPWICSACTVENKDNSLGKCYLCGTIKIRRDDTRAQSIVICLDDY